MARPCPCCLQPHGHSAWRVANSSAALPLRCKRCGQNFHRPGAAFGWLLLALCFPVALVAGVLAVLLAWAVPWLGVGLALGLAGALACACQVLLVWRGLFRSRPLVAGPRFG